MTLQSVWTPLPPARLLTWWGGGLRAGFSARGQGGQRRRGVAPGRRGEVWGRGDTWPPGEAPGLVDAVHTAKALWTWIQQAVVVVVLAVPPLEHARHTQDRDVIHAAVEAPV